MIKVSHIIICKHSKDSWDDENMNKNLEQFNNISFDNCYEYILTGHPRCDKIKQRCKFIYIMYIFYYYFVAEHTDPWHKHIKPFLFHAKYNNIDMFHPDTVKNIIESDNKETYKMIINMLAKDLTYQLGGEGMLSNTQIFNFTDLEKEVYILEQLRRHIGATGIDDVKLSSYISDNDKIIEVINGLNTIFSGIYKDEPLSTDRLDILFTNESKPLAINYIAKMVLISKHRNRMFLYTSLENIIVFFTSRKSFQIQLDETFPLIKSPPRNDIITVNEDKLYSIIETKIKAYIRIYNSSQHKHSIYIQMQQLVVGFINALNDKIYSVV